jgi:hypothetical protein
MASVITWTRLEPYSRSTALDAGLRADVRDPLWMLGRQWQFGELWGEDTGSPVQVALRMDCTPLTRYLPGGVPASWYATSTTTTVAQGQRIDLAVPLETVVERERVRNEEAFAPRLAAEAGLQFLRILAAPALRAAATAAVPLEIPSGATLDPDTQRFLSVMAGRVPDGALLASVLRVVAAPSALDGFKDPYKARVAGRVQAWQAWLGALASADRDRVNGAATAFLAWYAALFSEPATSAASAWIPERLEYELAVSAPALQQEVLLTSPEYAEGSLDWYSFDTLAAGSLSAARGDLSDTDVKRERVRRVVLPAPVRYPGMPGARYWEFEDARVDFGAIVTGGQQLAHLLLIEFALVSGDDWYVVPIDMPVGSVSTVRWLVVSDTFGERTLVRSAREVDRATGATGWDMFHLAPDRRRMAGTPRTVPDVFLLAPTLATSLHGTTIEEVLLLRDEMANMAWAVERVVESPLGQPFDRAEAYHRSAPLPPAGGDAAPAPDLPVQYRYRLANEVPGHWLPLLPARMRPDAPPIALLRGGNPRGRILEPERTAAGSNPLLIHEEELPRAGARVTREYQYTRWIDGSTHLWVGRRKRAGRGEGSSGLRFDVLEPANSAT